MNILKYLILFIAVNYIQCINENVTTDLNFIPTNEWQVVKPGQKLPPGLHIRSNLQTGITEAKIVDTNDKKTPNTAVLLSEDKRSYSNETQNPYSPEQLKRMLKNIKDESPVNNGGITINGTTFRSYEELKKDFETLQVSVKTDLEIIRELIDELKDTVDTKRIVTILIDLEYYLHQIDNGQNFVNMGGLGFLNRFIDSDDTEVRSEALRCLSGALQGNSIVKVEAMKNGTLQHLLDQLRSSSDKTNINQILVAISAITRQFPIAQAAFINGGGLRISGLIFDRFEDEKINVRLVTLITDWLKERNLDDLKVKSSKSDNEVIEEREQQYKNVDLNVALIKHGWCPRFGLMFSTRTDRCVDYVEKLVSSVGTIFPICRLELNNDAVRAFLDDAYRQLSSLAEQDTEDFYYKDVMGVVRDTLSVIGSAGGREDL